ncbi:hypothetical protein COLO4_32144 [Corchorus olitorius]|uniref:Uncharacterized protein n=1 Tax=Corchorus olitorius TaxID=93759 RepID=A0A1R3H177_9ROSI|nr:hypothetical protein COLO4_32144 [Corchorus olitorius]
MNPNFKIAEFPLFPKSVPPFEEDDDPIYRVQEGEVVSNWDKGDTFYQL